jgi:hypothetical protein
VDSVAAGSLGRGAIEELDGIRTGALEGMVEEEEEEEELRIVVQEVSISKEGGGLCGDA